MMGRATYYLTSVPTVLGQIENWYALPLLLLRRQPLVIRLKSGCSFHVRNLMEAWIVKEVCLDRDYESNSVRVKDGWTVVDVGAGIGEFAVLIAKEHANSRVFAFEPFPESFALLQENLKLNGVNNVSAFQMAVGSRSGRVNLSTTGQSAQHTTTPSRVSGHATSEIRVQALSLDDLFQDNCITHCDFLKIDCEGCEFEILFNASQTTLASIDNICLEYHDGFTAFSHEELAHYLRENAFQVRTASNPVHGYLGFLYAHR